MAHTPINPQALRTALLRAGANADVLAQNMSGNLVLTLDSEHVMVLNPNGSDRTVTLPVPGAAERFWADLRPMFVVRHSGGANTITVQTPAPATVVALTAGQVTQILWDTGSADWAILGTYDHGATAGGPSTGRGGVITAPTAGATYEIHKPLKGGGAFLRLKQPTTWPTAVADYIASPGTGWTWGTSGRLDAADANTTTAGALHMDHGGTASIWNSSLQTSPFLYKTKQSIQPETWDLVCRVANNGDVSTQELAGILVARDAALGTYARLSSGYTGSNPSIVLNTNGSNRVTQTITAGQRNAGVWLWLRIQNGGALAYYNLTDTATQPTTWTYLGLHAWNSGFSYMDTYRYGVHMFANNTDDNFTADFQAYNDEGITNPSVLVAPNTGSDGFDQTAAEQAVVTDLDMGTDGPQVTQAKLRLVLADLENTLQGDSATITWSAVASAGTGASSSTYQAAGSVTVSAGRYFNLWVKMSSGGTVPGSIGPFPIVITVD